MFDLEYVSRVTHYTSLSIVLIDYCWLSFSWEQRHHQYTKDLRTPDHIHKKPPKEKRKFRVRNGNYALRRSPKRGYTVRDASGCFREFDLELISIPKCLLLRLCNNASGCIAVYVCFSFESCVGRQALGATVYQNRVPNTETVR